ncbi:hypothetical protein F5887DRAFT_1083636 [Amanita rubescens]|nr:hypothetical protein F5887DRAFT_1083636 [Amanita rubescens]
MVPNSSQKHDLLTDAFDALASLDQLDGGITLVVRCPGYCVKSDFKAVEDITIDTYITPYEIFINHSGIQAHVALLVQKFAADVVIPHLHRFTKRRMEEGIQEVVWRPPHGKKFSAKGPDHLPPFEQRGSGYLRCHCFPAGALKRDIALSNAPLASKRTKVTRAVKKETAEDDDDGVVYMGSTTITQTEGTSSHGSGWQSASRAGALTRKAHQSNVPVKAVWADLGARSTKVTKDG